MAAKLNLSVSSDNDASNLSDQSVSSRSSNRSLRVAEKERKKNEAEDPFVLALKYFSHGRTRIKFTPVGVAENRCHQYKLAVYSYEGYRKMRVDGDPHNVGLTQHSFFMDLGVTNTSRNVNSLRSFHLLIKKNKTKFQIQSQSTFFNYLT